MAYSRTFSALSHRMRCSSPAIIVPPMFMIYAHRPTVRRYTHVGWGNPSLANTWIGVGNDPTSNTMKYRVRTASALVSAAELIRDIELDQWHVCFAGSLDNNTHYLGVDSLDDYIAVRTAVSAWPVLTTIFAGASDESTGVEGGMTGDLAWVGILSSHPPMEALDKVLRGAWPLDHLGPWLVHFWTQASGIASEADHVGGAALAEQLGTFTYTDNFPDPSRWIGEPIMPDEAMEALGSPRRIARVRISSGDAYSYTAQADLPEGKPAVVTVSRAVGQAGISVNLGTRSLVTISGSNDEAGAAVIGGGLAAGVPSAPAGTRHVAHAAGYGTNTLGDDAARAARVRVAAEVLRPVASSPMAVDVATIDETVINIDAQILDPGGYGWRIASIDTAPAAAFGFLALTDNEEDDIIGLKFTAAAGLVAGTTASAVVTVRSLHPSEPETTPLTLNLTAAGSIYTNGYTSAVDLRIGRQTLSGMAAAITGFVASLALTHAYLKTTANGGKVTSSSGYDIRIEMLDGTVVPYRRVSWDGSTGAFVAELRLPVSIGPSTDLDLVLYAGKAAQSDEALPLAVYADYAWAMDPTSGADLTAGDRDLTITGTWATAAGLAGLAASLNGSTYGTYASFGAAMNALSDFSVEVVLKPGAIGTDRGVVSIGDDLSADTTLSYSLRLDARGSSSESALAVSPYPNVFKSSLLHSAGRQTPESIRDAVTTEWIALIEGLDSGLPFLRFKDGKALANSQTFAAISGSTSFSGGLNVGRAGLYATAGGFSGLIQSLRLAARAPSVDRAWAMARNILRGSTFWAIGRARTPASPARLLTTPMESNGIGVNDTTPRFDVLALATVDASAAPAQIVAGPTATAGTASIVSRPLTGTLQTGSTATAVKLNASAAWTANQMLGRNITIGGNTRKISAYDAATKIATLATALPAAPGAVAYSVAYDVIGFAAPATAQICSIAYSIADANLLTAAGTIEIGVVTSVVVSPPPPPPDSPPPPPPVAVVADDFKPWRNRGFGNPVAGISFGNEFIPSYLAIPANGVVPNSPDPDRKLGYSGQAPASGLLCHIQFQIASSIGTDSEVGKSDGTGDWPFEATWRKGETPKTNDTVISRPGAIKRTIQKVQRLGSNANATTDGRRIHKWEFYAPAHGTARDGSKTQIKLATGFNTTSGYYVGARIYTWSGDGAGQKSNITAFDTATGVADVSPSFATAVGSGTTYSLGIETVADDYWHVLVENKAASPWTVVSQRASVNTLLWRTDNKWSKVPEGQDPPRRLGPYHGDNRSWEILQNSGSGEAPDDDRFGPKPWTWGGIVWGYGRDGADYVINEMPYFYTRDTMRAHGVVYNGRRIRQRWKHVLDDMDVKKIWIACCWQADLTRPTNALTLTVSQDDGTTWSYAVSRSPHATDVGTTDASKVSGWDKTLNNVFTHYVNWTCFDFGSTALSFKQGRKYMVKLTSTETTGRYMVIASREQNSGYQQYDNNNSALGFYDLHQRMGWINALRDRIDPDGTVKVGYPVKAEASTNGDTGPWVGSEAYADDEDFCQFSIWFEKVP